MSKSYLFTSESVGEGHPDKMADQVSDAILDAILAQEPKSRVACETLTKTGLVLVAGEITTNAVIEVEHIVRQVVLDIGYDHSDKGFDGNTCAVLNGLGKQSQDIAQAEVRKNGKLPWLRPDAKSQCTFRYEDNKPVGIDAVVLSTQHSPDISLKDLQEAVMEEIIKPVLPAKWLNKNTAYHITPTGRFVIGGPMGDCGLTGRKIIVDTYGGFARHGGGAFSGKDPSKVDRSAAYYARYIAKHIVASGLARRCEVQFAYAIGVAEPVSMLVDTFGTGVVADDKLTKAVLATFDARPGMLIQELDLRRPIFHKTAAYGHFGRELPEFTWEKTPLVDKLRDHAKSGNGHAVSNGSK